MTYAGILLTFAIVHLIAAASPGPNLVIVSSYASTGSRGTGLLAAIGILLGVLTWSSMAALGLGALLAKHPGVYTAVQHAGAFYLVWLGARMIIVGIRNKYGGVELVPPRRSWAGSVVWTGYLVNMTNPKTIAYYTSLFAVLIPATSPTWLLYAAVAVAFAVSALWWTFVAMVFSNAVVRKYLLRARRYVDVFMGGTLVLLGVRLAAAR